MFVLQNFKKLPIWVKISVFLTILIIIPLLSFVIYFRLQGLEDEKLEKIIDQKFHQEASQVPELKVKSFKLWEGDSMVEAEVLDKGTVYFWYGIDGVPHIDRINKYSSSWECFYIDNKGKKTNYAYTRGLVLDKESDFKKWFPFEVNSLKELVQRYDDIQKVLATFPKNPETIPFHDRSGDRDVVKKSNPEFILKDKLKENVYCDLFQ